MTEKLKIGSIHPDTGHYIVGRKTPEPQDQPLKVVSYTRPSEEAEVKAGRTTPTADGGWRFVTTEEELAGRIRQVAASDAPGEEPPLNAGPIDEQNPPAEA